jgi:hypothetical protein
MEAVIAHQANYDMLTFRIDIRWGSVTCVPAPLPLRPWLLFVDLGRFKINVR